MPKEAKASLGKARQVVHLTGKVNFPYSRLAGGLALQDRGKRFNQRFLKYKYRQISLKEAFSDCQDMFVDDAPSFFQLLNEHYLL